MGQSSILAFIKYIVALNQKKIKIAVQINPKIKIIHQVSIIISYTGISQRGREMETSFICTKVSISMINEGIN